MANTITIYILLTTLIQSDCDIKPVQHEYKIQTAHRELKLNYRLFAHMESHSEVNIINPSIINSRRESNL